MQQESSPHMLRAAQVAKRLGIGKSTWDKWVAAGRVKKGYKVGPKTVMWSSEDIDKLMADIKSGSFTTFGLYAKKAS